MREWGDFRQSQSNVVEIRATASVFFLFAFPVHGTLTRHLGNRGQIFFLQCFASCSSFPDGWDG